MLGSFTAALLLTTLTSAAQETSAPPSMPLRPDEILLLEPAAAPPPEADPLRPPGPALDEPRPSDPSSPSVRPGGPPPSASGPAESPRLPQGSVPESSSTPAPAPAASTPDKRMERPEFPPGAVPGPEEDSDADEAPDSSASGSSTTPSATPLPPVSDVKVSYPELGAEVVELVKQHFYDPQAAKAWAARNARYAWDSVHGTDFVLRTNRKLAELLTSHTVLLTPREYEYAALQTVHHQALNAPVLKVESAGFDLAVLPHGWFVRQVFVGGPAEKAGLQRGDRLLTVNGLTFDPVLAWKDQAGKSLTLGIQREPGGPSLQTTLVPITTTLTDEWKAITAQGARVLERNGKSIAYAQVYSCTDQDQVKLLEGLIQGRFRQADGLILDLRGGRGGCDTELLNLFNPIQPTYSLSRREGAAEQRSLRWTRPLYVLINGATRGEKEVVARVLQRRRLATLIGERSAGAVMEGRVFRLRDGALLFLATSELRVDGERLEGLGVTPDLTVPDPLPYARGADPQLEQALKLASGEPNRDGPEGSAPRGTAGGAVP